MATRCPSERWNPTCRHRPRLTPITLTLTPFLAWYLSSTAVLALLFFAFLGPIALMLWHRTSAAAVGMSLGMVLGATGWLVWFIWLDARYG